VQDRRPGRLVLGHGQVTGIRHPAAQLDGAPSVRLRLLEVTPRVLEPTEVVVDRRDVGMLFADGPLQDRERTLVELDAFIEPSAVLENHSERIQSRGGFQRARAEARLRLRDRGPQFALGLVIVTAAPGYAPETHTHGEKYARVVGFRRLEQPFGLVEACEFLECRGTLHDWLRAGHAPEDPLRLARSALRTRDARDPRQRRGDQGRTLGERDGPFRITPRGFVVAEVLVQARTLNQRWRVLSLRERG